MLIVIDGIDGKATNIVGLCLAVRVCLACVREIFATCGISSF